MTPHRTNALPKAHHNPAGPRTNALTADNARRPAPGQQSHSVLKPNTSQALNHANRPAPGNRHGLSRGNQALVNHLTGPRNNANALRGNANTPPHRTLGPGHPNRQPNGTLAGTNPNRAGARNRGPNPLLGGRNPALVQGTRPGLANLRPQPAVVGPRTNAFVSHIQHPRVGTGSVLARPSQVNPQIARVSGISHALVGGRAPLAAGGLALAGGVPLFLGNGLGGAFGLGGGGFGAPLGFGLGGGGLGAPLGLGGGLGAPLGLGGGLGLTGGDLLAISLLSGGGGLGGGGLGGSGLLTDLATIDLLSGGGVFNDSFLDGAILGANLLGGGGGLGGGGNGLLTDVVLADALQNGDISVGDLVVLDALAQQTQQNIADTAFIGGLGGFSGMGSPYLYDPSVYMPPVSYPTYPSTPLVLMPPDATGADGTTTLVSNDGTPGVGDVSGEGVVDPSVTPVVATTTSTTADVSQAQPVTAVDPATTAAAEAPTGADAQPEGLKLVLANARDAGGPIHYSLSDTPFSMEPGYTQTLVGRDSWIVEFDRGGDFGLGRYTLTEGTYTFTPTEKGWELYNTTFNVTLDNTANPADFYFVRDGREEVVKAGATVQLASKFPVAVSFDRGDGGQPAERSLADGTYRVGLSDDGKALELLAQ